MVQAASSGPSTPGQELNKGHLGESKTIGKQESYVGSPGFRRTCPRVGLSWEGLLTGQAAG